MNDRHRLSDDDLRLLRDVPGDQMSVERLRERILSEGIRPESRRVFPLGWAVGVVGALAIAFTALPKDRTSGEVPYKGAIAMRTVEIEPPASVELPELPRVDRIFPPTPADVTPRTRTVVTAQKRVETVARPRREIARPFRSSPAPREEETMVALATPTPKETAPVVAPSIVATTAPVSAPVPVPEETVVVLEPAESGAARAVEKEVTAHFGVGG